MERGGEIDGNDHVPVFARKFLDLARHAEPRVVDENINRAELRLGFLHHGVDFVRLRHLGARINRRDAEFLRHARPLGFDRRGVAHAVNHIGAFRARAMARPMPLVEPVTMAFRVLTVMCPPRGLQERGPGEWLHRHATTARRKDEPKPEYAA